MDDPGHGGDAATGAEPSAAPAAKRPRGRWRRLAARLGLTPVVGRRLLAERVRLLVGERGGYLVAVTPRHSLNSSSVDILVRFPQRSTLAGMREDLLEDPALLAAFGRKRRLPRWRRRNFFVGDGSVLLRLPYAAVPPRARRVERTLDGLVEAMRSHIRPLDGTCEVCGRGGRASLYLADGVPALFCEPCVAEIEESELAFAAEARRQKPDVERGVGLGVAAALAVGIAAGAAASLGPILAPGAALAVAAPIFFAAGLATSAVASRGLQASGASTAALELPLAALAAVVSFTTMNAVATMTLRPAIWNLTLLWRSSWGAASAAPWDLAPLAGAAIAGWLVEVARLAVARRRAAPRTLLERVDRPGSP